MLKSELKHVLGAGVGKRKICSHKLSKFVWSLNDDYREMLKYLALGYDIVDVAEKLGIDRAVVDYRLQWLEKKFANFQKKHSRSCKVEDFCENSL